MISKNRLAFAAISAGLVTSLVGMGAAQADPPSPRVLNGVGSDTTQDVMGAISNNLAATGIGGALQIGSYNATPVGTINTGTGTTCVITRPNGSGAGITALQNSLIAGNGCIEFARSSSGPDAANPNNPSLTYIPFATDAVSYALTPDSVVSRSLALSDLQAIYHCDPNQVGNATDPGGYAVTPELPQAGSGTRKFWEAQMDILDQDVESGKYPCIIDGTKNGQIIEEHTGTSLDAKSIVPFSIPQYDDQEAQLITDRRGRAILGQINGSRPELTNAAFAVTRPLYNVVPTSQLGVAPLSTEFVTSNSLVCKDTADIQKYGFALNASCGSTSTHSP